MRIDELPACCACPCRGVEELIDISPHPFPSTVAPFRNVRIVCNNCGAKSAWCEDVETAAKFWNITKGGAA